MKKKRKRITRPVQKAEEDEPRFKATFQWSTKQDPPESQIILLNPKTTEEFVQILNAESDDSVLWDTQKLSIEEIIERYPLTEEQTTKLKEYGKR